ncbi:type VI secretion system tube protein TssD [Hymenobacter weizhouensis]|uniref:type VI secretion system tube protein TssD n=1 Tax=Hymenobacter sp. YIM 151500-1 TaxID=2987689 RepID=UPI0022278FAE|nr:type VI secretion system tube protein TssD [Hymenobacter sp. YIM 151500-1]UYZ63222.1 hypothetical protein OIS53_19800 [Hymenobacter sp. YIM 151500-1]
MSHYSSALIEWHFRGHCYTPLHVHYALRQPTAHTGQVSAEVRLAGVDLWLAGPDLHGPPAQEVYDYMLDHYTQRSSLVLVRRPTGQPLRRLAVEDAYCTGLVEHFEPGNAAGWPALVLKLHLSPEALRINEVKVEAFTLLPGQSTPQQRERARTPPQELPPSATLAAHLRQAAFTGLPIPAPAGPTHRLAELPEEELLHTMQRHGLPPMGVSLSYLPSDETLRALTVEFGVEFAVIYTLGPSKRKGHYTLYAGDEDSVRLNKDPNEYLLKHTHPRGTPQPSEHDIRYLKEQQAVGSRQVKSVILPLGKAKINFTKDSPFIPSQPQ